MTQFFPDAALLPLLLKLPGANLYYWLWDGTPITPSYTDTLATYFSYYDGALPQTVPVSAFTLQSIVGHIARITAADELFTSLRVTTFYGYFVTDAVLTGAPSGNLVMAAAFDVPVPAIIGTTINITPTLALQMG